MEPNTTATTATIGTRGYTLQIEDVQIVGRDIEDGGTWLRAIVEVSVYSESEGTQGYGDTVSVHCGCWADTDDDGAEWMSQHEGERLLYALITGDGENDATNGFLGHVFCDDVCDTLGAWVCTAIRRAAITQETP